MKTKTKNQLIGIIIGTAIALGVNMIPDLAGGKKMFVLGGCILVTIVVCKLWKKRKNSNN